MRNHARLIRAKKVGARGRGQHLEARAMAGLRLPIESHVLQAFVSEAIKPLVAGVITFGAGHFYISQSDKGGLVFGGDIDGYNSYAQRGNLPIVEDVLEAGMALMPLLGRAARAAPMGRRRGHDDGRLADHRHDARSTGLYLNAGWCYGGFKATPAPAGASPTHRAQRAARAHRRASGSTVSARPCAR